MPAPRRTHGRPSLPESDDRDRSVVSSALPADQVAARSEPRGRRVAAGRGDPERAGTRRPLRRVPGHGAQGSRRARRRQPGRAPPGQGHLRRLAHRGAGIAAALSEHPTQRRAEVEPAIRLLDLRRGKAGAEAARLLDLKIGDPVVVLRRVLSYDGVPTVLDEITLPAALFRGLTRARIEAYRGSVYALFETQFGVRVLKAEERLRAIGADGACAAILAVAPGAPLLAVDRVTLTWGEKPVEWRRSLCTTCPAPLPERTWLMDRPRRGVFGATGSTRVRAGCARATIHAIICCRAHSARDAAWQAWSGWGVPGRSRECPLGALP